jgi:drug/metabolite transporter (DMT)-like permease
VTSKAHPARAALLIALAGFFSLSIGDAVVKSLAEAWPPAAVAALRYTMGAVGLAALVAWRLGRGGFVLPRPALQFGRGAAVAVATLCFFAGVYAMPLADATAIQFSSPIITALLAPLVLGERTTRATWAATLLAFAGVLIVLRPNVVELGAVALFPVAAAFAMSWLMMFNRMAAADAPVLVMQLVLALFAAPLLVAAAVAYALLVEPIPMPSALVVAKCAAIACFATLGHALIFAAVKKADASVVAPMTYVQLVVAAGIGWSWFGDRPDLATFGGAALIIAGGLLLWRAQRTRRAKHESDDGGGGGPVPVGGGTGGD